MYLLQQGYNFCITDLWKCFIKLHYGLEMLRYLQANDNICSFKII